MRNTLLNVGLRLISLFFFLFYCTESLNAQNDTITSESNYFDHRYAARDSVLDIDYRIRQNYLKGTKAKTKDSILMYYNKALQLIETSKDEYFLPNTYYAISNFYLGQQDFTQALNYGEKLLKYSKENNIKRFLFVSNQSIGRMYVQKGENNNAVNYYSEALKYATDITDEINIKCGLALTFINEKYYGIGEDKRFEVAQTYIDEILEVEQMDLSTFSEHKRYTLNYYLVYGYIYGSIIASDNKIIYATKAATLAKELDSTYSNTYTNFLLLEALTNVMRANYGKGNFDLAIKQSKEIMPIAKKSNSTLNTVAAYMYAILSLLELNRKDELLKYADTLSLYKTTTQQNDNLKAVLFRVHFQNKDFEKASNIASERFKIRDTLFQFKKEQAYLEFGKKYQTEKKIQENELLKKENIIKDIKAEKQETTRNYLILLALFLVIISVLLLYGYRQKQRVNKKLEEKNKVIRKQKISLESVNTKLEKSNEVKEKILAIISHDLVNSFNSILGFSVFLEKEYEILSEKERKEYISIVNKGSQDNYDLVKNLLSWARLRFEKTDIQKQQVNLLELVNEVIKPLTVQIDKKELSLNNNIEDTCELLVDKQLTTTVVTNLLSNAIKYSYKKGEVHIYIKKTNKVLELYIEDFGVGLSQQEIENILGDNQRVASKAGTQNEKGIGLGLQVCKEIMILQKGLLQIDAKQTKGVIAKLQFKRA